MNDDKFILVTGGAGYIGSHTVVSLAEMGYIPVIVDDFRNSDKRILDGLKDIIGYEPTVYEIDILDRNSLEDIFRNYRFSGVMHFAAYKSVSESVKDPLKYYTNNVTGLINVLNLCIEYNVRDFVFSSSCTVYGEPDHESVDESTPLKPASSPYGATKQICEQILSDMHSSGAPMRVLSLRYFNPIGAHSSALIGELPNGVPDNLIPYITQTAIGKRASLNVFGNDYATSDGTCIRDYIHVMDLAEAHTKGLFWLGNQTEGTYEVLNIGTGEGTSVLEIINTFEKVSNVKLNWQFSARRPGDVSRIYAEVSKAEEVIGWKATRSVRESVFDAWNWELKLKTWHE